MPKRFNASRKKYLKRLLMLVLDTEKFWSYRVLQAKLKDKFNSHWAIGHIASVIFDMNNIEWKYVYSPNEARIYAEDLKMWISKGAFVFRSTIKHSMLQNHGKYKLVIIYSGPNKLNVVREVRNATGKSLKDSKDLVEGGGIVIYANSETELEPLKNSLEALGATCETQSVYATEVK